jgi:hypothetical protein
LEPLFIAHNCFIHEWHGREVFDRPSENNWDGCYRINMEKQGGLMFFAELILLIQNEFSGLLVLMQTTATKSIHMIPVK